MAVSPVRLNSLLNKLPQQSCCENMFSVEAKVREGAGEQAEAKLPNSKLEAVLVFVVATRATLTNHCGKGWLCS